MATSLKKVQTNARPKFLMKPADATSEENIKLNIGNALAVNYGVNSDLSVKPEHKEIEDDFGQFKTITTSIESTKYTMELAFERVRDNALNNYLVSLMKTHEFEFNGHLVIDVDAELFDDNINEGITDAYYPADIYKGKLIVSGGLATGAGSATVTGSVKLSLQKPKHAWVKLEYDTNPDLPQTYAITGIVFQNPNPNPNQNPTTLIKEAQK